MYGSVLCRCSKQLWLSLLTLRDIFWVSWSIIGDFNDLMGSHEKIGRDLLHHVMSFEMLLTR